MARSYVYRYRVGGAAGSAEVRFGLLDSILIATSIVVVVAFVRLLCPLQS